MARAENTQLVERFQTFYREYYKNELGQLARQYPTGQKSLFVDWQDLYQFDPDLADDVRSQPGQLREYAEEALRLYDLPAEVSLTEAHVRIRGLPETTEIREIRADHRGRLLAVRGIVRKATDVRPKITEAAFECQRCGTLTRIPQAGGEFQEPHECQGCERQGPFRVNFDQSAFIDAQKIRVQESPEGLRGGETPQSIDVSIEDDVTGKVTAGDHVTVTGILKLDQQGNEREQSPMFDVYMDGMTVEIEDEQFEEMEITEAEKSRIVELSSDPEIYEQMVGAIAPSIYGYDDQKLAMVLQLFSGVTKHLPDGSRIRGDLHMLLIGDPGTGKCVSGDTFITLADGSEMPIRDVVESNLTDPTPIDDGVYDTVDLGVPSLQADGTLAVQRATKVWKRTAPETMCRIRTASGREIEVTPSHPLFVQSGGQVVPITAAELSEGDFIAVQNELPSREHTELDVESRVSRSPDAVRRGLPEEWTPRLARGTPDHTNADVIPGLEDDLKRVREALAIGQSDCGIARTAYQHYERGERNPSRRSLRAVVAAFESRLEEFHDARERLARGDWTDVKTIRRELNISQDRLVEGMSGTQTGVKYDRRGGVVPDGGRTEEAKRVLVDRLERGLAVERDVRAMRALVDGDVAWDRIESIERTPSTDDWVYDLEVDGPHNYLANGIVSHNSQLLQYVRNIAPRSVYTSGKGASTAGLTAAAVRDDFGDGQQWTLEAGALVLADKGIAAVDELDKMRCVTGDTLVTLGDGRIERISDLASEAAHGGEIEPLPNGRTIRNPGFDAWTMTEAGKLEQRPVTAVHEYEAPEVLNRVCLQSGETLTATPDHPFLVFQEGTTKERSAEDLKQGDWVCVPRQLTRSKTDGGVLVDDGQSSGDSSESDECSPALGAVLGYLSGGGDVYADRDEGGSGIRFTNQEEELLDGFEMACRTAFDGAPARPPAERREDGARTVRLGGKQCVNTVLDAGLNLRTSDEKGFPTGVTRGSFTTKAAFVRALADSEGAVDVARGAVRIGPSSRSLLQGVKQLLLEFDISCQLEVAEKTGTDDLYTLEITGPSSLTAFNQHIGFTLSRKQTALERVCEDVDGTRTSIDVIPDIGAALLDCRTSLRLRHAECGINPATYRKVERGEANVSIRLAHQIVSSFEQRQEQAQSDLNSIKTDPCWADLEVLKDRYHVSREELISGSEISEPSISDRWGTDEALKETVRDQLHSIIKSVAETELTAIRNVVRGDVKWRRIEEVTECRSEQEETRTEILRARLGERLGCPADEAVERAQRLLSTEPETDSWSELRAELTRYDVSVAAIAADLGVAASTVSRWCNGIDTTERFDEVQRAAMERIRARRSSIRTQLDEIDQREKNRVYDLSVAGTKNYVANGMVVHNSEDRSSLHESLEQQSVSISKAGINATLKARCSLLGAANPKYGRFDQYEPIAEQIDLEPALISRFDLIFTVTDEPDAERDADLADHIIKTNYAGELHTHREQVTAANHGADEVAAATDEVAPTIEPELLRKYIAYARRTCFPTMTDPAKAEIRDFYVDLRSRGADEDAPVPVTARKLEALVRLAEASARVRLSDTVDVEDAERATDIVLSCLREIGMDPETGQFDADVIETGTSKSQRDRIKSLKALVADIEDEYDEGAPIDVVLERAEEAGMESGTAEHEIEQLKQKGEIYEPRTDHLRTT